MAPLIEVRFLRRNSLIINSVGQIKLHTVYRSCHLQRKTCLIWKIKDFFPKNSWDFSAKTRLGGIENIRRVISTKFLDRKSTLIGAITFFTIKWINYVSIGVVGIFANEIRHHSSQNLLQTHSAVPRDYTTDLLNNLPKEPVTLEIKCFFPMPNSS